MLRWAVKTSLIGYVRGMADGRVACDGGAIEEDGLFVFPEAGSGAGALRFAGAVRMVGHGGLLRVVVADPALVPAEDGWILEIADPDEPGARLPFARIPELEPTDDGWTAHGTALTEDGADLFFGPYEEGTPIDDPTIGP